MRKRINLVSIVTLVLSLHIISCDKKPTESDLTPLTAVFLSYPAESNISSVTLRTVNGTYAAGAVRIRNTGSIGICFNKHRIEDIPAGSSDSVRLIPSRIVEVGETTTVELSIDDLQSVPSGSYIASLVLKGYQYSNGVEFLNNTITKTLQVRFEKP